MEIELVRLDYPFLHLNISTPCLIYVMEIIKY